MKKLVLVTSICLLVSSAYKCQITPKTVRINEYPTQTVINKNNSVQDTLIKKSTNANSSQTKSKTRSKTKKYKSKKTVKPVTHLAINHTQLDSIKKIKTNNKLKNTSTK